MESAQNLATEESRGRCKARHMMVTHPCGDHTQSCLTQLSRVSAHTLCCRLSLNNSSAHTLSLLKCTQNALAPVHKKCPLSSVHKVSLLKCTPSVFAQVHTKCPRSSAHKVSSLRCTQRHPCSNAHKHVLTPVHTKVSSLKCTQSVLAQVHTNCPHLSVHKMPLLQCTHSGLAQVHTKCSRSSAHQVSSLKCTQRCPCSDAHKVSSSALSVSSLQCTQSVLTPVNTKESSLKCTQSVLAQKHTKCPRSSVLAHEWWERYISCNQMRQIAKRNHPESDLNYCVFQKSAQ